MTSRRFPRRGKVIILLAALLVGGLAHLRAQGGPPMITDDPGTPGDKHWEINLAWTDQRTPGSTDYGLPLLDANYGVGDRIELNYQAPWVVLREADEPTRAGLGDSLLGVKWRFYDAGEQGWQASVFPQVTFPNPGSRSDRRGLADSATTCLLPFEVMKDFGSLSVNCDFGHTFSSDRHDQGWMGGVCVGHEIKKGWELDAEVHAITSENIDRSELTANLGSRIDLTEQSTLLLALGRDLSNTLAPRVSLLSYLGIQIRL